MSQRFQLCGCGLAVVRALGSRSEGRGFDPRPMLDGSDVKAMHMPGLISTPNSDPL